MSTKQSADFQDGGAPEAGSGLKRTRSPMYPAMSLAEAVEVASSLYGVIHHHPAPAESIAEVMGIKGDGSAFKLKLSALKKFALVEEAPGEKWKLTDAAQDIAIREASDDLRRKAIRMSALQPALYAELWERFGPKLPGDSVIKVYLLRERGFNPNSVDRAVRDFRLSVEYAGLTEHSPAPASEESPARRLPAAPEPPHPTITAAGQPSRPPAPGPGNGVPPPPTAADALQIPIGDGRYAVIPSPMEEEMYEILLQTLQIWKPRLVKKAEPQKGWTAESGGDETMVKPPAAGSDQGV